ncbi:MAG: SLATT domain-containing protein [Peptostreptococcaceae bacterium]|nr:SLATT domain-containing protein [Peptostreptococcaceae bacterium]
MEKLDIEKFLRKIWITKKSRIIGSERLNRKDEFFQKLSVSYSIIIVALSIWNIQILNTELQRKSSYVILITSIAVSLFAMFITSRNYKERYFNLKINYTELDILYTELENIKSIDNIEEFNHKFLEISKKYNNLLMYVENHSTYDYLIIMSRIKKEEKSSLNKEQIKLLRNYKFTEKLCAILFVIVPPIAIFLLIKYF